MFEMPSTPQFEEEIRAALKVPMAREEFLTNLHAQIMQRAVKKSQHNRSLFLRSVWVAAIIAAVILTSFLSIGPQRVIAAMRSLFGYIPGVGIVDQSAPFRVLAEPVTVTRDEVSITVTSALLTSDRTYIEYRIFGVPGSAYPDREDIAGCTKQPNLRLPDGSQLNQVDNAFQPVPARFSDAVLVIPCIFDTLPGKAPENWELPLHFVPAPPNLTVMPVIELSPTPLANLAITTVSAPLKFTGVPETNARVTPAIPINKSVTFSKVIETSDGYILVMHFTPQGQPGEQVLVTGAAEIRDANGKRVFYTIPQDIALEQGDFDQDGTSWAVQFRATGLVYPLTVTIPGVKIIPADPNATSEFTFDAGLNPQPGQEWTPDQQIQLAGHSLKVISIRTDASSNYSFTFSVDPQVHNASLQIVGYTPIGGGGGGGGGLTNNEFNASLTFAQLPTGILTVKLSNLLLIGDAITWQGQWSPDSLRTDLPANPAPPPGLCMTMDDLSQLEPIPSALTNGKVLVYEKTDDIGKWGLALHKLDGSQKQIVVSAGNWGALSLDGSQVAYSALDNGIHLVDVDSMTDRSLPGVSGFDIHWSPDGTYIAYIGMGDGTINSALIAKTDGSIVRQVSNLSYETIIGWSPDGAQLYFAVPYTEGAAWKVYSYDVASGAAQARFAIENGTPKFLAPSLSPDGQWIAYRGRDNSSVYLVRSDGSDARLLMDNVDARFIEWSNSGWLGASLRHPNSDESMAVIIRPDSCEVYLLPIALQGDLQGLYIP